MKKLLNFGLFQAAWFVAVAAAARGDVWLGVIAFSLVVLVHLAIVGERAREVRFLIVAGLLGTVVDTVLSNCGIIAYPSSLAAWSSWIVPPWIAALWIGFATLPRFSLAWLAGRPLLAAALGAIGGPLSFLGGVRMGAIAPRPESALTWIVLAIEYAVVTPLLLWLAPRGSNEDRVENAQKKRAVRTATGTAGILIIAAAGLTASCVGMKKTEIESRLMATPKNALVREAGLQRRTTTVKLEHEPWEVEYTWTYFPARGGAGAARGPIVLVHGTPSTLFNWSTLLSSDVGRELTASSDVYALDVIGHGVSKTKGPRYTFQICADSVRGFLELLDLRDVTIVGQSYGGEFAWRVALDAPERVTKLVLIDSSGYRRGDGEWLPEEEKLRNWPGAQFGYLLNSRERLRPALQLHFGVPITDEQLDEMYLCCENADNWRSMTQLCRDENGTREKEIVNIRQPTLLVWGANDIAYTVEKCARRFERDIAGSKLVVVASAGHYPHEEQPNAVARALLEFHRQSSTPR